jgi:hypothetical protein
MQKNIRQYYFPKTTNQTQWWEAGFGSILWPFMWIWNK